MLKHAPWTLLSGHNIETERGESKYENWKKLTRSTKQVFFFLGVRQLLLSMIVALKVAISFSKTGAVDVFASIVANSILTRLVFLLSYRGWEIESNSFRGMQIICFKLIKNFFRHKGWKHYRTVAAI